MRSLGVVLALVAVAATSSTQPVRWPEGDVALLLTNGQREWIAVTRLDGSAPVVRSLTPARRGPRLELFGSLAWSAAGQLLVRLTGTVNATLVVDQELSTLVRVRLRGRRGARPGDAALSPDGAHVAVEWTRQGRGCGPERPSETGVAVVRVADSQATWLRALAPTRYPMRELPTFLESLHWSPDGTKIAYAQTQYAHDCSGFHDYGSDLLWIDAGGGRPHRVARTSPIYNLDWSPEGERLAAAVVEGPGTAYPTRDYLVTSLTGKSRFVAALNRPAFSGEVEWSPLGDALYVVTFTGGNSSPNPKGAIDRVPLDGGRPARLTVLRGDGEDAAIHDVSADDGLLLVGEEDIGEPRFLRLLTTTGRTVASRRLGSPVRGASILAVSARFE